MKKWRLSEAVHLSRSQELPNGQAGSQTQVVFLGTTLSALLCSAVLPGVNWNPGEEAAVNLWRCGTVLQ